MCRLGKEEPVVAFIKNATFMFENEASIIHTNENILGTPFSN